MEVPGAEAAAALEGNLEEVRGHAGNRRIVQPAASGALEQPEIGSAQQIGRASCRERVSSVV